jgi:hypothetical protein
MGKLLSAGRSDGGRALSASPEIFPCLWTGTIELSQRSGYEGASKKPIWLTGRPFDAPKSKIYSCSSQTARDFLGIDGKNRTKIFWGKGFLNREAIDRQLAL